MEQIIYRPYGSYRFLAWVFICLAIIIFLLSYYFILPALFLLIPAFFLFRAGKVIIIADKSGIQLFNEKTSSHRCLTWEQLKCYQLTNNMRGHDVILLSSVPLPTRLAKRYANIGYYSTRLWFDSILIIPLFCAENSDTLRKFIYQMTELR
jgi:hypothetical protein